jgi:hypothetical protein
MPTRLSINLNMGRQKEFACSNKKEITEFFVFMLLSEF